MTKQTKQTKAAMKFTQDVTAVARVGSTIAKGDTTIVVKGAAALRAIVGPDSDVLQENLRRAFCAGYISTRIGAKLADTFAMFENQSARPESWVSVYGAARQWLRRVLREAGMQSDATQGGARTKAPRPGANKADAPQVPDPTAEADVSLPQAPQAPQAQAPQTVSVDSLTPPSLPTIDAERAFRLDLAAFLTQTLAKNRREAGKKKARLISPSLRDAISDFVDVLKSTD